MAKIALIPIVPDPEKIFDLGAFLRGSADVLNKTIHVDVRKDFESVTGTWKDKPSFRGKRASTNRQVANIWGNKDTWVWINRGTRPHLITPKRAPALRFQTGYRRKTTPRKLGSRSGGATGPFVSAKRVRHPGTPAGDYDVVSAEKQQPVLVKRMNKAVKEAA